MRPRRRCQESSWRLLRQRRKLSSSFPREIIWAWKISQAFARPSPAFWTTSGDRPRHSAQRLLDLLDEHLRREGLRDVARRPEPNAEVALGLERSGREHHDWHV